MLKELWWQISLLAWWSCIAGPVCHAYAFPACYGSSSVKGFYELPPADVAAETKNATTTITAGCCDPQGDCFGGLHLPSVPSVHEGNPIFVTALQSRVRNHRSKRQAGAISSPICQKEGCLFPREFHCCQYKLSVFFPISAISLRTGRPVTVIQLIPHFVQPVIFGECLHEACKVLNGTCQQVLVPQQLWVADTIGGTVQSSRDDVLVDHGCECKFAQSQVPGTGFARSSGLDNLASEFFNFMGIYNVSRRAGQNMASFPFVFQP